MSDILTKLAMAELRAAISQRDALARECEQADLIIAELQTQLKEKDNALQAIFSIIHNHERNQIEQDQNRQAEATGRPDPKPGEARPGI